MAKFPNKLFRILPSTWSFISGRSNTKLESDTSYSNHIAKVVTPTFEDALHEEILRRIPARRPSEEILLVVPAPFIAQLIVHRPFFHPPCRPRNQAQLQTQPPTCNQNWRTFHFHCGFRRSGVTDLGCGSSASKPPPMPHVKATNNER